MNATAIHAAPRTSATLWVGRALSAFVILFLTFDSVIKLIDLPVVATTMAQLGYPTDLSRTLGVITLVCTVLYAIPRTAILGAILLTGLLGGAIATHLRVGSPLFSHLFFGVYVGLFAWAGLYLRNAKLRALIPFNRE